MRCFRPATIAGLCALLAAGAAGCSSAPGSRPGVVRVVAAENFWGDIARQLGGAHVEVRSIISDPSTDPHQYESDARDAARVADAHIVIVNGLGYDDFVSKLVTATSNNARVVLSVQHVLHVPDGANPHLWYDLPRIPEVARAIAAALIDADSADRGVFEERLQRFVGDASLARLRQLVSEIKTKYPKAPVAYTERVPQYLLDAAGLTNMTPPGFAQAIEDGNEPGPGDAQAMNDLLSGHKVRALLYNAQATSAVTKHVQDLAGAAGVPVVPVTETMPENEPSYQAWQLRQVEALLRALGG